MTTTTVNLTKTFRAIHDRYAKRQGPFLAIGQVAILPGPVSVWEYMVQLAQLGLTVRVLYRCRDGIVRDLIGRGGVHDSSQDGTVQGIGRPMTDPVSLTLSFWTFAHGDKVNTGTGKGYRTLRAAGILAFRCEGKTFLTQDSLFEIRKLLQTTTN